MLIAVPLGTSWPFSSYAPTFQDGIGSAAYPAPAQGAHAIFRGTLITFANWLQELRVARSILNTIVIGLIGGAAAVVFYTAIACAVHRWRSAWAPTPIILHW